MNGLLLQTWPTSRPNSFHYSHLFQWSSGSSSPRGWHYGFRSGPLFRSSGHPTNAPLCYHPALEWSPSLHHLFYTIVVKISRHARQALRIALPRFHWFNLSAFSAPWTNTKQNRDPLDSITIGYFNFFVSLFGRWSELLENFCQVYRCNWYGVWRKQRDKIFALGFVESISRKES